MRKTGRAKAARAQAFPAVPGRITLTTLVVGLLVVFSWKGVSAAQRQAAPLTIPIFVLCGEGAPPGGPFGRYATRVEITMAGEGLEGEESGEIVVAPDILAGEVNPGETVVIQCEEILQGRGSFFGFVTVQLFPGDAFVVNVVYASDGASLNAGPAS